MYNVQCTMYKGQRTKDKGYNKPRDLVRGAYCLIDDHLVCLGIVTDACSDEVDTVDGRQGHLRVSFVEMTGEE